MTLNSEPNWIKNIHKSQDSSTPYTPEIDKVIFDSIKNLSFQELNQLASDSGIRERLGVLTPPDEWSREQYIEILSDISDMPEAQVEILRELLGIKEKP